MMNAPGWKLFVARATMSFDQSAHRDLPTYALRRHRLIIQLTTTHSPPTVCFHKSNMAPDTIDTILFYAVIVIGIILMTLCIEEDVPREITLSLILEALIAPETQWEMAGSPAEEDNMNTEDDDKLSTPQQLSEHPMLSALALHLLQTNAARQTADE
ncbi:hypothetical protein HDK64DRAFT_55377 [Phyllosticta capitalensis]